MICRPSKNILKKGKEVAVEAKLIHNYNQDKGGSKQDTAKVRAEQCYSLVKTVKPQRFACCRSWRFRSTSLSTCTKGLIVALSFNFALHRQLRQRC
jgi:hypothetical protein